MGVCCDWSVCLSYLHFILSEANDTQGFPHYLPVIAVIYGAHFGTVTLKRNHTHSISSTEETNGGGASLDFLY